MDERAEREKRLETWAQAVAQEMSNETNTWTVCQPHEMNWRYVRLTHQQTDMKVGCGFDDYHFKRVSFSICAPQQARGGEYTIYDQGPKSISVAFERDAKAVAADVMRRFTSGWLALWPGIIAKVNETYVYEDVCSGAAQTLADILPCSRTRSEGRHGYHSMYAPLPGRADYVMPSVEAEIYRPHLVNMKLQDIPFDMAKQIVELLATLP